MEIESSFTVPLNRENTWRVLLDIPRIAPCMPGARLTGADEEAKSYDGEVQVRLGPVMLAFAGKARIVELVEADHKARVTAEGRDKKGRGGASAEVLFCLAEVTPNETRVDINTVLNLSGSIAQYGRGSGMINDLANHLIGQFAENLRQEVVGSEDAGADHGASAPNADTQSASENTTAQATADTPEAEDAARKPATRPKAASAAPISGFRLAWMLFRKRLQRLFGSK
jgi:uncharacterized protein